jgi:hypothetical protein
MVGGRDFDGAKVGSLGETISGEVVVASAAIDAIN